MRTRLKTVGVIGGMGPAATLDFYSKLLTAATAAHEQDRLRILIDCDPAVPDRNAAVAGQGPSPGPKLADMARGLERIGAEFLVMPCNAAHAFVRDIKAATQLPFVSIIEATVSATRAALPALRRVGVLASSGCIDAGLYQESFARLDVWVDVPETAMRERFMKLLYKIKSGDAGPAARAEMRAIAEPLIAHGAEAIIAGCTEVPLVLSPGDLSVPLVSSTDCLVAATLEAAAP